MQNTSNYGFNLPDDSDFAKIQFINENFGSIDNLIKALQDGKASNTNLTTLDNKVTSHLEQTTYQKYIGSLKDIDYTCNVYADGSTADRPHENISYYVDVMVRPELKDSFRTLVAYRAIGTQLEIWYLKMVNSVWGEWVDYTTELRNLIAAKYTKPSSGIPKSDLSSIVQTSLGKADASLQSNKLKAGSIAITPTAANTPTSRVVSLVMPSSPNVTVTAITSAPKQVMASVASVSQTGFTVWLDRDSAIETYVNYTAVSQ